MTLRRKKKTIVIFFPQSYFISNSYYIITIIRIMIVIYVSIPYSDNKLIASQSTTVAKEIFEYYFGINNTNQSNDDENSRSANGVTRRNAASFDSNSYGIINRIRNNN